MNKLAGAAVVALLAAATLQAQSVPPSITSSRPGNPAPGVSPSITGFGPFNPPPRTTFTPFHPPPSIGFVGTERRHGGGHRPRRHRPIVVPYAYPVYYPVVVEPQPEPEPQPDTPSGNALDREMWSQAAARQDRNIERNDIREAEDDARYGEHFLDEREERRRAPAAAPADPGEPEISLILVLQDGTRLELGNYAIVGATIYDLSQRGRKVQLAQLDLPATQKANDDLGLDFRLPGR